MNNGPFTLVANPDCHRLHDTTAICLPITGFNVQMQAVETIRAVVAMFTRCTFRNHKSTTIAAVKLFRASMGLVVALFKRFSFIFTIHKEPPSKIFFILS
jgi:hypothetical protein